MIEMSQRSSRHALFRTIADSIRLLPPVRGKVRLGLAAYKRLIAEAPCDCIATLHPEQLRFHLNLASAHERMALLMNGYEPEVSALIAELTLGGHNVIDVGANIGLICLPAACRLSAGGKSSHIYAVEAVPSNGSILTSNVCENDLIHAITVLNVAAGDTDGVTAHLSIEGGDARRTGTANILPDDFEFDRIPVSVRTLDALCDESTIQGPIGFIKVDTDGYDLHVLRGAKKILETHRPPVYAELNLHCLNWHGLKIQDVLSFLRDVGYQLFPQCGSTFQFHEWDALKPFDMNALLVPLEKKKMISSKLAV